jgi:hypothetical protein
MQTIPINIPTTWENKYRLHKRKLTPIDIYNIQVYESRFAKTEYDGDGWKKPVEFEIHSDTIEVLAVTSCRFFSEEGRLEHIRRGGMEDYLAASYRYEDGYDSDSTFIDDGWGDFHKTLNTTYATEHMQSLIHVMFVTTSLEQDEVSLKYNIGVDDEDYEIAETLANAIGIPMKLWNDEGAFTDTFSTLIASNGGDIVSVFL